MDQRLGQRALLTDPVILAALLYVLVVLAVGLWVHRTEDLATETQGLGGLWIDLVALPSSVLVDRTDLQGGHLTLALAAAGVLQGLAVAGARAMHLARRSPR